MMENLTEKAVNFDEAEETGALTAESRRKVFSSRRARRYHNLHNFFVFASSLIGTVIAIYWVVTKQVGPVELLLCAVMYVLTGLSMEVGFHRYFTHKSFKAHPLVRGALAIFGCMAGQTAPRYWVSVHRYHHAYSDEPEDLHSPATSGKGIVAKCKALYHSYMGWMYGFVKPSPSFWAKDLAGDKLMRTIDRSYGFWLLAGLLLPAFIDVIITGTWIGFFKGLVWGGLVRMFVLNQVTNLVNSFGHTVGQRTFPTTDGSTNIALLSILTVGGSWHNNHHAFPWSAITGFGWRQIDLAGCLIHLLEKVGLVYEVKMPTDKQQELAAARTSIKAT